MGSAEITTEPHELILNGVLVKMQADPTVTPEWEALLETQVDWTSTEAMRESRDTIREALAGLAETPEDGDTLRAMDLGVRTFRVASQRYMEMVVGFPTQPPSNSTKRGKKT